MMPHLSTFHSVFFRSLLYVVTLLLLSFIPSRGLAVSAHISGVKQSANLRCEPMQESDIICSVPLDETVEIVDESRSPWIFVEYQGKQGFIRNRYLTVDEEAVTESYYDSSSDTLLRHQMPWLTMLMMVLTFFLGRGGASWLRTIVSWGIPLSGLIHCTTFDPFWFISFTHAGFFGALIGYIGLIFFLFMSGTIGFMAIKDIKREFADGLVSGLLNLLLIACTILLWCFMYSSLAWYNIIVMIFLFCYAYGAAHPETRSSSPRRASAGSDLSSQQRRARERQQEIADRNAREENERAERQQSDYESLIRDADNEKREFEYYCDKAHEEENQADTYDSEARRLEDSDDELDRNKARDYRESAQSCRYRAQDYLSKANYHYQRYESAIRDAEYIRNHHR